MKQIAKVCLFLLHIIGVVLCVSCTVIAVDRVVTLVPRYTQLGGWLSHLEADSTQALWLTTWSLGLAAVPAMGLFCFEQPTQRRGRRKRSRLDQSAKSRVAKPRRQDVSPAWEPCQDELLFSWVEESTGSDELVLAGAGSPGPG